MLTIIAMTLFARKVRSARPHLLESETENGVSIPSCVVSSIFCCCFYFYFVSSQSSQPVKIDDSRIARLKKVISCFLKQVAFLEFLLYS